MNTKVVIIDPARPDANLIENAAEVLRSGRLVAFPTETVYGLGADALNPTAVARIFEAKGRPASNPLIVHVSSIAMARDLARDWPEVAERLSTAFWPGPLTLIVRRSGRVPSIVTAGGPTVALRMPAHPVAQALIEAAQCPVAAPSANRSSQLSPTLACHVIAALDGRIDMILDGGPTAGGIESTVLDVNVSPPRILRPGLVSPAQIEAIVGEVTRPQNIAAGSPANIRKKTAEPARSPGTLERHYAPRAPLTCAVNSASLVARLRNAGERVGWLQLGASNTVNPADQTTVSMPNNPGEYSAKLYAALHDLDRAGVQRIVVELPPDTEEWMAIRDRLAKAATPSSTDDTAGT